MQRSVHAGLAMLVLALAACRREAHPLGVGEHAPAFGARTLAGDSVTLAALTGKAVLLNIWATWCAPCRDEIPYLEKVYASNRARGLELAGVSIDFRGQEPAIKDFASELGMTYPIWLDPDNEVMRLFAPFGVPATYLIDRRGVVRWTHVGIIRPSDRSFSRALEAVLGERATK